MNIEGIDGAGKSTLAAALHQKGLAENQSIKLLEKRNLYGLTPYKQHHLSAIKGVLWDYSDDDPIESLGDNHWYHLICCWYHAISEEIRNSRADIILCDGYYYKYLARFALKENADIDYLRAAYRPIRQPDINVLLDIDPAIAFQRKKMLKRSESGAFNGFVLQDVRTSFIDYQGQVSAILEREMRLSANTIKVDACNALDDTVAEVWEKATLETMENSFST
ncbi:hypothetical protein AB2N04_01025 (plasmid) [Nitratireductor sp. GISD-1A_MAKvit]|uniref:dTMP kinase n=1 Tax=Nitratireductor sp. GISD-1A_MAKvit TaxID=3234198 RepID=UPI003466A42E